jgi:hypothetical protein
MLNDDKNKKVIKKVKIKNGEKVHELNVIRDNYIINIINIPKKELIKFKICINNSKELNISTKENFDVYENQFDLKYFSNQTPLINDLGIKKMNDLIRFLYTYFQEYNEKNEIISYDSNNPNIIILKLQMFHNKIQILVELFNNQIKNKNIKANEEQIPHLKISNSCKNLTVHKKELKTLNPDNNNTSQKINYYISIIQKNIPLLQNLTKEKLILIYKSSNEKEKYNFHEKCDDKGPTLIFIYTEENRSFITFNKKSWHLSKENELNKLDNYSWRETNIRDDDIVIIDLFSKKKLEIKKKKENHKNDIKMGFIQQYYNYSPSYIDGSGFSFKIFGGDKYLHISFITNNIEENNYIRNNFNLNKNNFLHIKDYEVYCFKSPENKK